MRRLLLAREAPPERQRHLLAWSHFRRRHQAHASRAHAARRAHAHTPMPARTPPTAAASASPSLEAPWPPALRLAGTATLTQATWAQIAPLLPTLQRAPKRTRYEHRWVLDGILALMHSGRSWREGPAGDIPWPILYQRYRRWHTRGVWDAILRILHPDADILFVT